jgi:hypothetical protein
MKCKQIVFILYFCVKNQYHISLLSSIYIIISFELKESVNLNRRGTP